MRLLRIPSAVLSILVISFRLAPYTSATPIDESLSQLEEGMLFERGCAVTCGYYTQVCCAAGQACVTSNNVALCGGPATQAAVAQNGQWQWYTTTYVETDIETIVSTISPYIPAVTNVVVVTTIASGCQYSPCGNTCCSAGQFCSNGVCVASGGGSSAYYSSYYTSYITSFATVTSQAGVPLRPTSGTVVTVTSTGTPTTTVPFVTPVGTDGSTLIGAQASTSGGLSGGAIAGIVIGVIAGIIILLLICACCCFKGLLDGLLAIFGLGPRSRRRRRSREETYIEERHSHRDSGGRTGGGRTWFGTRPARVDRERKSSGFGGIAGVTAALGALALILGLKRRRDRRDEKSSYGTGSSYYSSEYTSSSK